MYTIGTMGERVLEYGAGWLDGSETLIKFW